MKKFLFTLVALLMAGSLCAEEYFYVNDFEVSQELLQNPSAKQRRMKVNVYAHFEYLVSGWQVNMTLPEKCELKNCEALEGMTIHGLDAEGNPKDFVVALSNMLSTGRFIGASSEAGYYYPEGVDPDEDDPTPCGANKWEPGEYLMFNVTIQFDQDFEGGELVLETTVSCGEDPRPNTCPKGQDNFTTAIISVEGGSEPVQTPAPVINVTPGDDAYVFEAVGEGEVTLFADLQEVENPYTVVRTDVDQVVKLSAVAHVEGQIDGNFSAEYVVPALEVVEPEPLTGEIIVSEPDEDGNFTVTYTGTEDVNVTVTVDGEPYNGEPLTEGEHTVVVTVEGEGYETMTETFTVTYTAPVTPPEPEVTPVPNVTFQVTDDAYIFTAEGEGDVVLYVNDEAVENPYTIERPEAGEEPIEVFVYATAKDGDKEMSQSDVIRIEIEPKAEIVPPAEGVQLVIIDQDGVEHTYDLGQGSDGDFSTTVTLNYVPFGQFEWNPNLTDAENEANRPNVPFYFVVDGVRYGAEEGDVATVLGYAMQNPLTEDGEGFYTVPVGYSYTLGIALKDGAYYVYGAVSTQVGVDELNADKAIAGVRYFNMAGQEMQEANGMTIVVTTYTDGTTSAVKVMK